MPTYRDMPFKLPPSISWLHGFHRVRCSQQECTRWISQRQLSQRPAGVTFDEQWYCRHSCMASALGSFVSQSMMASPMKTQLPDVSFERTLLRHCALSTERLREVRSIQKRTGQKMQQILIRKSLLDEENLRSLLALHWRHPSFSGSMETAPEWFHLPETLTRYFGVTLVRVLPAKQLLVGFVHSIDYGVLLGIEKMMGYRVEPCFITATDFDASMKSRTVVRAKELAMHAPPDACHITRIVCEHSVRVRANRIKLVRCERLLWARLNTSEDVIDLFFANAEIVGRMDTLSSASHAGSTLAA